VDTPYIEQCGLILECKLRTTSEIGIHTHFIGEIMDVKAENSVLGENGLPDILKVRPILFGPGMQAYYSVGQYLGKAFAIGRKM